MDKKMAVVIFLCLLWSCIFLVMGYQYISLTSGGVTPSYALCLNQLLDSGVDTDVAAEACQP